MAINVMTHVWKHSKCKGSDLLALLAIADWCNDFGDCYSGLERLAEKTRVSKRGFQKIIERLEAKKELLVYPHMGVKTARGKTNAYRIPMEGVNDNLPMTTPILQEKPRDVQPRVAKTPKHKPFPKPVKTDDYVNTGSPSEGSDQVNLCSPTDMNTGSPSEIDSMNTGSPTEVNTGSPNTLVDTQDKRDTLEETPIAAAPLKLVDTSKKKERKTDPYYFGLIKVFDLDPQGMTKSAKSPFLEATRQLIEVEADPADIPAMYEYTKNISLKEGWKTPFGPVSLAKHYPNFLKWKAVQQRRKEQEDWENGTGKSFTPTPEQQKELDDVFAELDAKFSGKRVSA